MCTVVVRWTPGQPALVLALRDERVGRAFDDPAAWWPDQPSVIGGRDREAGGSWCVSDVTTGVSALVLNRPQRPHAGAGAPSRGALPLLVTQHGRGWPAHVDVAAMASFALVRVAPESLVLWTFDGVGLETTELSAGTHMITSGGAEDGKADLYLAEFAAARTSEQWRSLLIDRLPEDDPAALVVRHEAAEGVYATVFSQIFELAPGRLSLTSSRTPWLGQSWASEQY
jgi:hypothetical protein